MDTSGPMATNCGDVVSAEAGKKGAAKGPSTSCRVLYDDGELSLVFVAVGASEGWTASLLSLPTLEHHGHLVDLGVSWTSIAKSL